MTGVRGHGSHISVMLTGLWKEVDHGLEGCVYDVSAIGVCGVGIGGGCQRE